VRLLSVAEPLRYDLVSALASRIGVTEVYFHFAGNESNDSVR
jgi:hypothetical protein